MAGLSIHGRDQPIPGHPPGNAKHPVIAGLDILAGHQRQQLDRLSECSIKFAAISDVQCGVGIAHQRIHQRFASLDVIPIARRLAQAGVVIVTGQCGA